MNGFVRIVKSSEPRRCRQKTYATLRILAILQYSEMARTASSRQQPSC